MICYSIKKLSELVFENIERQHSCYDHCTSLNRSEVVDCPRFNEKRRRGVYRKGGFEIYICSNDTVRAKRLFSNSLDVITNFATEIDRSKNALQVESFKNIERLIHNLKTYNAHCIQLADIILEPNPARKGVNEQLSSIVSFLREDPEKAALYLLKIIKNNKFIQGEISIYDTLLKSETSSLNTNNHQIHRLLKGVLSIFFEEFQEKNVLINLNNTIEEVMVDYQTFICSLNLLFENAVKYICPGSTIEIFFSPGPSKVIVTIEMTSLQIMEQEKSDILHEGVSGFYAKKLGLSGKGLGMSLITQLLQLNSCHLTITPNIKPDMKTRIHGIPYERNLFVLEIPKKTGLLTMA